MPRNLVEFAAPDLSLGLNLQSTRNLKLGEISSGQSVRYEKGSGIMTGPGFRSVATPVADVRVDAMREATVYPAMWVKAGTKIQYSEDVTTFYDTGVTVTANRRTGHAEQGNGDMYFSTVTDTPLRFVVGRLAAVLNDSDVTITMDSASVVDKFPTSGTVYIRGDAIAYTGKSGATLTGVTGIQTGGHPNDSLVVLSQNPSTWVEEKGDVMMNYESRLLVGGRTGVESVLYYSGPEDAANPAFFYDFDANGAFSKIFPGKITGMISGLGRAYLFMTKGVHELKGFEPTTGALLSAPVSETYGAYNANCVVDMDGTIAFMGQKRLMPITLKLAPDSTTAPYLGEAFDENIRAWLDTHDDDQSDAFLKWDSTQKILKIGAVVNGALETYGYDANCKAFFPLERRNVASSCMFLGKSYFGDRDNGKVYEDDVGRTNDGIAIIHRWRWGRMEYKKGKTEMQAKDIAFDGFMTQGSEFTIRAYLNGSSSATYEETFDDSLITSEDGVAIGSRGIGISTISDGSGELAYPFKLPLILRGLSAEDFAFEVEVDKEGAFVQFDNLLFRAFVLPRTLRSYA